MESVLENLILKADLAKLYVSHISNLIAGTADTKSPLIQFSVKATIMLKDIHPLFEVWPVVVWLCHCSVKDRANVNAARLQRTH